MAEEPEHYRCPLFAVDQRLEDLHRQWHAAEGAYFDPDAFRVAIQTAIQTSRTVTFILQSNKGTIPKFDEWYTGWREKLASVPLMRWMVDARNKIEKQGDLETYSVIRAEIVGSYLEEGPRVEVPAVLSDVPLKLLRSVPQNSLGDHLRKSRILRIQRRWVENTLPEHELLDAVAIAYGYLAELIRDAHLTLGLDGPSTTDNATGEVYANDLCAGRLPCMIGHADMRSLDIPLATGRPVEIKTHSYEIDKKKGEAAAERYGLQPEEVFPDSKNPEDTLRSLFSTARRMFLADGYHITIIFLLRDGALIHMMQIAPEDQGEKYLLMRSIGHEVVKRGADAVVMLGEVWTAAYDATAPYRRAGDAPEKSEAVMATLVSKTGEPIQLSAIIHRKDGGQALDDTVEIQGGAQYMFAPIYEAWGRAIPNEWLKNGP